MPHKRAPAALTLMLTMLLLASSCGGPDRRITTTTSRPPQESEAHLKSQILAAYNSARSTLALSLHDPDAESPELGRHFTGDALARLKATLAKMRRLGQTGVDGPHTGRPTSVAAVIRIRQGTATVEDCRIDDGQIVSVSTHLPVNADVETHHLISMMRLGGGIWRMDRVQIIGSRKGIHGCAISGGR